MVFCGKCGADNPDINLYCRKCGAHLRREEKETIEENDGEPTAGSEKWEKLMTYRVALISMGVIMCAIILLMMFYMKIPFNADASISGVPSSMKMDMTLWDILNGGFSPVATISLALALTLAFLSLFYYLFSLVSILFLWVATAAIITPMNVVALDIISITFGMEESFVGTLAGIDIGLTLLVVIPIFLDYKYAEFFPSKGVLYRMKRLWKV